MEILFNEFDLTLGGTQYRVKDSPRDADSQD